MGSPAGEVLRRETALMFIDGLLLVISDDEEVADGMQTTMGNSKV
jgi:hypothetical protein